LGVVQVRGKETVSTRAAAGGCGRPWSCEAIKENTCRFSVEEVGGEHRRYDLGNPEALAAFLRKQLETKGGER